MTQDLDIHDDFVEIITEIDDVITILEDSDFELFEYYGENDHDEEETPEDVMQNVSSEFNKALMKLEQVQQMIFKLSDLRSDEEKKKSH